MTNKTLRQFLVDANKTGYGSGDERQWIKESDESTTIPFEKGEWKLHDNFFGGEPYGGRMVAFYKNKPVWMMVYYGWVEKGVDPNLLYGVLRNALMRMPEDAPFRGPKHYEQEEFTYTNHWTGNVERYFGEEQIIQGKKILYNASYRGGLVDQQAGI